MSPSRPTLSSGRKSNPEPNLRPSRGTCQRLPQRNANARRRTSPWFPPTANAARALATTRT
eukprot:11199220-Lingulodinium_polyedra.AAC.1